MRSSVSVILSSPVQDPNMSHPDYEQTAVHHASILVLVKHLGEELNSKGFNKIFERISKICTEKVTDSTGVTREIFVRYIKDYTIGNNEWGDFQTHRRLLGLITVGKCNNQNELNEICVGHERTKLRYSSTLFDSRCIILGLSSEPEGRTLNPPIEFKSRALYYATEVDENAGLEKSLSEFISSLFWVLESKRQERSREKIERVSLLVAPFEKKDFVGIDMESRSNKKRCLGRMAKQLGDLCLQAGLHSDALTHYHAAIDTLRSVNDWLWLAGACEGLSAASVCVRFPKMCKSTSIHRNSSLPEGSTKIRSMARSKNLEVLEASNLSLLPPSNVLNPEDICKSYREAIVHYSKFQNAGVIETECCFKAARVSISLNLVLHAATFLQNIIFINLVLPEDEKVERLMTLSELYTKLGFQRKASFYRRLAANRYVSARNPQTDWERCYNLMLQALPGHKLTLDPTDYSPYGGLGWGGLQKTVLLDVAGAARRAGLVALATRHMTLLLQVMWRELTSHERNECAMQLQNVASQCEGSPVSLVLDNGLVIPPANLLHIPTPSSFSVQKLRPLQQPSKLEKTKEDYGPFVFTPIKIGSLERKAVKDNKLNYLWVAEEMCEVKMELSNPLPFELEVSNMRLLTSGVVFESLPLTVILPPQVHNFPITLTGTPREVGELEITGYSTHTLGVKSNCRLKSLPKFPQSVFIIEVVPALPLLTSCLKVNDLWKGKDRLTVDDACHYNHDDARDLKTSSTTTTMVLYGGERADCELVLENTGSFDIDVMEISVETVGEVPAHAHMISYDSSVLTDSLPLKPATSVTLPISVNAVANFLNSFPPDEGSMRSSIFSTPSGPNSFPSVSSYRPATTNDHLSPNSSLRSGPSSLNSLTSQFNKFHIDQSSKGVECRIKVRYSGGPGLSSGYCRITVATLKLEIQNSVLITNWDVLPAETSNQFYMVLDFANMTDQEIELKYTETKSILIEENESCRVPIPVERCPLSTIAKFYQEAEESIKEVVEVNRACCEHISSRVEVSWHMGQRHGFAYLRPLTLSSSNVMLDIVRMSPIKWEVKLNDIIISEGAPRTIANVNNPQVTVGQCVQVSISGTNSLPWQLTDVCLSLHFFQDYQNGICNFTMDTHLAIAGPDQLHLPVLEEGTAAKYEVSVVFFCAGLYKMNIQCTAQKRHTWRLLPPIEIEVKPPA